MNLAAVAGLPSRPIVGVWYRAIDPQHLRAALGYSHTRRFPSRYYEGQNAAATFDIVYLAENPMVAQFEVGALFGSPLTAGGVMANPARSWLTINAQVQLTKVVDLTDVPGAHVPLATSAQELTGDWKGYRDRNASASVSAPVGSAPTQDLGAALHASGLFEGFLAISAKLPWQMVLGVFPGRVGVGSFVRYSYLDPTGNTQTFQIP
jgi:RES domain-containing protein